MKKRRKPLEIMRGISVVALFAQQSNILEFPQPQKSNEWYTPRYVIEAAREVMGSIDLDPASCLKANQIVRATCYYSEEQNGLAQVWYGNVWLNPPFGKTRNQSNQLLFVNRLANEYRAGNVKQAILLITPKNTCAYFQFCWDYLICFADHHIKFHRPDGTIKDQMFGVCFVYLGKNEQKFIDIFSAFGTVARRVSAPKQEVRNLELWRNM
jgi:ParB family chromosome partitioning protein